MQLRTLHPRGPLAALVALALLGVACSGPVPGGSVADPVSNAASASAPGSDPTAGASPPASDATAKPTPSGPLTSDPLHQLVLTDVRSGQELTLGQLAAEKPLLLETMAIWCSNCKAQQHNVIAAHNQADFHSVSVDVDPGESPSALAEYAERERFDWHFAMADAQLLGQLRERFGTSVAVPPAMPKILFRTDGTIELIGLGELYTAQQIADAVNG